MQELQRLYELIRVGKASDRDRDEFLSLLALPENEPIAKQLLLEYVAEAENNAAIPLMNAGKLDMIAESIMLAGQQTAGLAEKRAVSRNVPLIKAAWLRYAAAAIILLGVAFYGWFWSRNEKQAMPDTISQSKANEIEPGRQGAILTLADGSEVLLDTANNGYIADQGGVRALLKDGRLAYNPQGTATATGAYNTVTTPKGRQFSLILPDGSQVWLNAASSIRYPTVFTGNERNVEITGEVYFEVTAQRGMPLRVKINGGTDIEVLGTRFNVNAYQDEPTIKTTLLEGAVRVNATKHKQMLKPGQQAQISTSGNINVISNTDMEKVIAWKNGFFNFDGADLKTVMGQLERWYNIQVKYEGRIPGLKFEGELSRDLQLVQVLKILEKVEVKFRLEGSTLIVSGN